MNGGEALIRGLHSAGVEVCFANPGTSEMHMVQAIDGVDDMRAVLCLFEGVATGAADGYARMRGLPACTLLHLGAGLGNGIANLHNARRASSPIVNVIGDHAQYHTHFDAPLTSNITDIARGVSSWIRKSSSSEALGIDARDAVAASLNANPDGIGNVATLIVPADCAWGDGHLAEGSLLRRQLFSASQEGVENAARALDSDGDKTLILLDGNGLTEEAFAEVSKLVKKTGCSVYTTTFPARVESGPGLLPVPQMLYFPEDVMAVMSSVKKLVLAGSKAPVSFFAYQATPSNLVPEGCEVIRLAHKNQDVVDALARVAEAVGAEESLEVETEGSRPQISEGALDNQSVAEVLGALMPKNSVISTDSGGGRASYSVLQNIVRHSFLSITGGSIGQGGPVSLGAAVACPGKQVFALLGDGGAIYTNQYLWTAARENLDLITIVYSNRTYSILETEYRRLGVNSIGEKAASLFDLGSPDIDWCSLARGYGVPGSKAETKYELAAALENAMSLGGPHLIEVMVTGRN